MFESNRTAKKPAEISVDRKRTSEDFFHSLEIGFKHEKSVRCRKGVTPRIWHLGEELYEETFREDCFIQDRTLEVVCSERDLDRRVVRHGQTVPFALDSTRGRADCRNKPLRQGKSLTEVQA